MNRSRKTEIVEDKVVRALLKINQEYGDEIVIRSESDYETGVIRIRVKGGEPD